MPGDLNTQTTSSNTRAAGWRGELGAKQDELKEALKSWGLTLKLPEGQHLNGRGFNKLWEIYQEHKARGAQMTQKDVDLVRTDRERYIDKRSSGFEAFTDAMKVVGAVGLGVGAVNTGLAFLGAGGGSGGAAAATSGGAGGVAGGGAAASGINFASPVFDPLAGGSLFNPMSPQSFNQAMGAIGSSGAAANWPSFMQNAFNTAKTAFGAVGGALGSPLGGALMDAYRENRAVDAMTDSIRDARGSINQGLGSAQNYIDSGVNTARNDLQQFTGNANSALQNTTQQARRDIMPYYQGGLNAFNAQQGLLGLNGMSQLDALRATPGYQFNLNEGIQALQNQMAARGLSGSGNEQQAILKYAQGLADNTYNNAFNQYGQVANMGYNAAGTLANQQQSLGSQLSGNYTNQGNTLANMAFNSNLQKSANQMDASQSNAGLDAYKGQTLANAYMGFPTGANTNYTQPGTQTAPQQSAANSYNWLPGALSLAQMAFR